MTAVSTEPIDDRTRTWGILSMSLLSAVLATVLIWTRPPKAPEGPERSRTESPQRAPPQPAPKQPEAPAPAPGDYYRGWPLFEGWPLPQMPSGTGGPEAGKQAGDGGPERRDCSRSGRAEGCTPNHP
jgi:hypothetical protein